MFPLFRALPTIAIETLPNFPLCAHDSTHSFCPPRSVAANILRKSSQMEPMEPDAHDLITTA
jgi:hypothetical protein